VQIRAAAQLWDGTGSLLFTGSAGIFTVDDGSQCNEDSPIVPLGVSDRNDRCRASILFSWQSRHDVAGSAIDVTKHNQCGTGATVNLPAATVAAQGALPTSLVISHCQSAAADLGSRLCAGSSTVRGQSWSWAAMSCGWWDSTTPAGGIRSKLLLCRARQRCLQAFWHSS